jgi:hypothetical protein
MYAATLTTLNDDQKKKKKKKLTKIEGSIRGKKTTLINHAIWLR